MALEIRKVDSPADYKAFFEFPWALYKDDPNWVPPLKSMRSDVLDKKRGAAWEYMDGEYFTAWRDGQLVGTIGAVINHRHNEFHQERIGWFGAFEVRDDAEASRGLLDAACAWVRAQGYDTIRGPQTFSTHEETGLLVDGFTRPVLLYPYNYPYYEKHVLAAGFAPVMDTYGYFLTADHAKEIGTYDRLQKLVVALMKRNRITVRPVDRKNLKAEFALFKELYNAAWEKNWSFVPMTPRELDNMVNSLGQFFDARVAFFAYVDQEPVGFVLGIPDFNLVLHKSKSSPRTPEIITLLKALYYWKVAKVINWGRVPLLGVKEAYRNKGVDVSLYGTLIKAFIDNGYVNCDSGWILATNQAMNSILDNVGATRYKTFRYYEKAL